ncbi:MAG: Gfo/Idh/MocA family oxidoreductase [Opitutales bacterium]|nr:Gfo/Idh/MocA family oxidoreductase [Opitutales bacterium]
MEKENTHSRRSFIKSGSMAAVGATVSTGLATSVSAQRRSKKLRVGVVGGRFGSNFWAFKLHPDCEVVAVSDLRPKRLARMVEVFECNKTYPSLEEMVTDRNIDAIAVFTGAPDHVDHATKVMEHGKHVLCAVPACMGSVAEGEKLLEVVKRTGQTYMMAETSYYRDFMMSARDFYEKGLLGDLYYFESAYHHPGLKTLYFETGADGDAGPQWKKGQHTWRYGFPPGYYYTHNASYIVGLTGERLVEVSCTGWGDDDLIMKDNAYNNPFWNTYAQFKTDRGNTARIDVVWNSPVKAGHPTTWLGNMASIHTNGTGGKGLKTEIVHQTRQKGNDDVGYEHANNAVEPYEQKAWYKTDLLPEELRVPSGHGGSHNFLVHEFVDAIVKGRKPTIDIYEALAYTLPGIVAYESALKGGERLKIPQLS